MGRAGTGMKDERGKIARRGFVYRSVGVSPPAYRDSYEFPDPRHLAGITLATVGVVGPRLLIEL